MLRLPGTPAAYFGSADFVPAYRSLEEMDTISMKTRDICTVVETAKEERHRYDKEGNLWMEYEDAEAARRASGVGGVRRRSTVAFGEKPGSGQQSFA